MTKSKLNLILGVFCLVAATGVGARQEPAGRCQKDADCPTDQICVFLNGPMGHCALSSNPPVTPPSCHTGTLNSCGEGAHCEATNPGLPGGPGVCVSDSK